MSLSDEQIRDVVDENLRRHDLRRIAREMSGARLRLEAAELRVSAAQQTCVSSCLNAMLSDTSSTSSTMPLAVEPKVAGRTVADAHNERRTAEKRVREIERELATAIGDSEALAAYAVSIGLPGAAPTSTRSACA
jgi:hypothetical protein